MPQLAAILVLLSLPLGPAVQAICSGIFIAVNFYLQFQNRQFRCFDKTQTQLHGIAILYMGWLGFSTFINSGNIILSGETLAGYFCMIGIPFFMGRFLSVPSDAHLKRIYSITAIICLAWAFLCASQMLWGWKLSGSSIVDAERRARGFYSHPLTLAYVILIFVPSAINAFLRKRTWQTTAFFLAVMSIVFTSNSRTVQLLTLIGLCWSILRLLNAKQRVLAFLALFVVVGSILATPNSVSRKFYSTLEGTEDRLNSEYKDDRIAFFHANWWLFQKRPLTGYGEKVNRQDRIHAYEAMGMQDFPKKYESHNTYLETLVQSGFIGLAFFLAWLAAILKLILRQKDRFLKLTFLQTVLLFCLGSLTQNTFQDSEVRLAFVIFVTAVIMTNGVKLSEHS